MAKRTAVKEGDGRGRQVRAGSPTSGYFWRRSLESCWSQEPLALAEDLFNACRYIDVLSVRFGLQVDRLGLVPFDGRDGWKPGLATTLICIESRPPRFADLWSVSAGASVVPVASRLSSRFVVSIMITDAIDRSTRISRERSLTSNMISQIDSRQKLDKDSHRKQ